MPVITVDLAVLPDRGVKENLVKSLTSAASQSTGIPEDKFIVLLNEMPRDNIGIGGRLLSDLGK